MAPFDNVHDDRLWNRYRMEFDPSSSCGGFGFSAASLDNDQMELTGACSRQVVIPSIAFEPATKYRTIGEITESVPIIDTFADEMRLNTEDLALQDDDKWMCWTLESSRDSWLEPYEAALPIEEGLNINPQAIPNDPIGDALYLIDEPQALTASALQDCVHSRSPDDLRPFQRRRNFAESLQSCSSSSSARSYSSDADWMSDTSKAGVKTCICSQCGLACRRLTELEKHAKQEAHKAFRCQEKGCAAAYSRRDALLRHRIKHDTRITQLFECTQCDKYRGSEAFKRKDHLRQHVQKVHAEPVEIAISFLFCEEVTCKFSKADSSFNGFEHKKDFERHRREAHGKGTLDCNHPGCERVGAKGFARDRDLRLHVQKVHDGQESSSD